MAADLPCCEVCLLLQHPVARKPADGVVTCCTDSCTDAVFDSCNIGTYCRGWAKNGPLCKVCLSVTYGIDDIERCFIYHIDQIVWFFFCRPVFCYSLHMFRETLLCKENNECR